MQGKHHLKHHLRIVVISIIGLCLVLIFTWAPFLSRPPQALAHAFVINSDPVDGSTMPTAPALVKIYFNAPINSASIAYVYAFTAGGSPNGQLVNAGRSRVSSTNPNELDTSLLTPGSLPQGSYEVKWTALANDDGHTTSGLIGFNVGQSSTGLAGTPTLGPSTSNHFPQLDMQGILATAWDWLVLAALMLWIGILVMEVFITTRPNPPAFYSQVKKQARPLQMLCLFALLAGEVISLILRGTALTQALGGSGIDLNALSQLALQTNYGHLWMACIGLIIVALCFLWWTTRRRITTRSAGNPPQTTRRVGSFRQLRQEVAEEREEREGREENSSIRQNIKTGNGATTGSAQVPVSLSAARSTTASLPRGGNVPAQSAGEGTPIHPPPAWHTVVWFALAGLILLTMALSSDIAQLSQLQTVHISVILFEWLYLAAQSVWFGSAAYLGFVLLPLLPAAEPDHSAATVVGLLKRYTPMIAGVTGVLLVSGVFLTETTISDPQQFLSDPYGRTLLVHIGLIILTLIFTAYALFALLPKLQRQTVLLPVVNAELPARRSRQNALEKTEHVLKQTMRTIAWLGAAALLCIALMTFFAPPVVFPPINYAALAANTGNAASTPVTNNTLNTQTKQAGGLSITLQVTPARVNYDNTVIVTITDASGNPVTDAQVQLTSNMEIMNMGVTGATIKSGNPTYITVLNRDASFTMAGLWDIDLQITRPGHDVVKVKFSVMVEG